MKRSIHLILLAVLVSQAFFADAQQFTKLTPPRGHYKQLSSFSPVASDPNADLEKLRFHTDQKTIDRRLSLKPIYLADLTVDDFDIPEAPANSSAKTRAEIRYLLSLQSTRSEEDIRTSLYMADVYYNLRTKPADADYKRFRSNLFFIGRSVGSWFNADNLPETADLMAKVWQDASYFIWSLKFKYARVRPVVIDSRIKNLQETDWAAYPSGHASNSYVNAFIYMELASEFADYFIKDAYDMAHSREILGVHFPSDSEAGRIFARQFVNKLFQNEKFQEDFAKVRAEWAAKAKETLD